MRILPFQECFFQISSSKIHKILGTAATSLFVHINVDHDGLTRVERMQSQFEKGVLIDVEAARAGEFDAPP